MRGPQFSDFRVVSFDVFDTLVSRLVCSPIDVFALVEARTGMKGFEETRVLAERTARAKRKSEITLDDIYAELDNYFPQRGALALLKSCELQVEKDVCVANAVGKRLYEEAVASGARIVITSDMYLPAGFLEDILRECGYVGWELLFVSCERAATKASGALYDAVVQEIGVKPSEILHVGDNMKSDILRARMRGLATFRVHPDKSHSSNISESFVIGARGARKGVEVGDVSYVGDFGYRCLGPVLVGFCGWLKNELEMQGIEKVFYLARDGLIIQRAMTLLGEGSLSGTYLYASRRALQVPSIALLGSFRGIVDSMFLPRTISLRKLFRKMGLDEQEAAQRMVEAGIDPDVRRETSGIAEDADSLKAYGIFSQSIERNAEEELEMLTEYLRQNGFEGKVAIVDIGWFGNMQLALERICNEAGIGAEIYGYYVGLSPDGENQLTHRMKGYLFDATHDRDLFEKERCYNLIFETLFSAPHGTTRRFRKDDQGVVIPVLASYSGVEAEIGAVAQRARDGAIELARDCRRVLGDIPPAVQPRLALRELNKVGVTPSLAEANFFGSWGMEADGETVCAAEPKGLNYYATHVRQLVRDFTIAPWKVGFLKLLFKVPFPYGPAWIGVHSACTRRK